VASLVGREAGEQVAQQVLLLGAKCCEQFSFGVVAGTGYAGLGPPPGCGDLGNAGASVVWVEAADDQAAGFQPVQQRGQGVLSSPSTWPSASWVRPGSAICADSTIQSRAPSQFLRLGHIERAEKQVLWRALVDQRTS
jgi:hypothetical protein